MLSKKILIASLFLMITGLIGIQTQAHAQDTQGGVTGEVVDASTGEALSDIEISVEESGETATTDSDGRFTLENLEPGMHTLNVEADGYETWSQTVEIQQDGDAEVEIRLQPSM